MPELLIDLRTVLFLTYATNALLSVLLASSGRSFRGAWLWVCAQSLMALGTFCDAFPASTHAWIPFGLGNSAYSAAALFYCHAIWIFRYKSPFPRWLYAIIPLQIAGYILALSGPYFAQTLLFSLWMSFGPFTAAALLLWKVEPRYRLPNVLTALPFLVLSTASISRVIMLLVLHSQNLVVEISPLNVWYVGGAVILSTIMLFGYFMMTSIREMQLATEKDNQINARNARLLEANKNKDLFFAIIAHDLRGPISGSARFLRKSILPAVREGKDKVEQIEVVTTSLERTSDFLEKLLWWSKSQLSTWTPRLFEADVFEILEKSLAMHKYTAEAKGLSIEITNGHLGTVVCDPESIEIILGNLIANAIKYSNSGTTINIYARALGQECQICVQDHGIGMDYTKLIRLFRIDDKVTTLGTNSEAGNGLGLILSQSLAERNKGRIELESQPGKGTLALLYLPLATKNT